MFLCIEDINGVEHIVPIERVIEVAATKDYKNCEINISGDIYQIRTETYILAKEFLLNGGADDEESEE